MTILLDGQPLDVACPFNPQPGAVPQVWFAREGVLRILKSEMDRAEAGEPSKSSLFSGASGLGKSALLNWSAAASVERGWPTIRLAVTGDVRSPAGFARALSLTVEKLRTEQSVIERAKKAVRKLPVRPQIPYLEYAPRATSSDTQLIEGAFEAFDAFVTELQVPGLIAIDEVHQLEPGTAEALVHYLSDERDSNVRVVAAGLSSAWSLLTMKTMSVGPRVFRPFELVPFSNEQSQAFIRRSLDSVGASWPDWVVERVADLSWGSPGNIHELAYSLWLVQEQFTDHSWLEGFIRDLERETVRDVKRRLGALSPTAYKILGELQQSQGDLALYELRMSVGDDASSFRDAMDQLEIAGLANVDPDQNVQAVGPPGALTAIVEGARGRIDAPALER